MTASPVAKACQHGPSPKRTCAASAWTIRSLVADANCSCPRSSPSDTPAALAGRTWVTRVHELVQDLTHVVLADQRPGEVDEHF
jgi:hypothetical protein